MQPCSQPRYGFKLVSNPTSGLVFRVMIVRVPSRKYCVGRRRGASSESGSTSTTSGSVKSTCSFSNRFAGLHDAPRPRIAAWLCGSSTITGLNFRFAGMGISSHEHITVSSKSSGSCYTCAPTPDHRFVRRNRGEGGSLIAGLRRGGRAVDRAGLENRKAERSREFESHPLRIYELCETPLQSRR
jgi:hypothetical protein